MGKGFVVVTPENAQIIALQALGWLVADKDLVAIFMGSTGCSAESLKAGLDDPVLLRSVLDFILMEDQWVIDFCGFVGLDPFQLKSVRGFFPGGDETHWT